MTSGRRGLIFEKNLHRAAELRAILESAGYGVRAVFYPAEAQTVASRETFDFVIAGFDVFPLPPALEKIRTVITAPRGKMEVAEEVIVRFGLAASVMEYPFDAEEVLRKLRKGEPPLPKLPASPPDDIPYILGKSDAVREMKELLIKAAQVSSTVLLLGETGTGKELAARALHDMGPRKERPFVALNCAALPETLLETELFGHERGAFTGAVKRKAGRFETAHRGTLFLDEVGDVSPAMQVKLLRVLESGSFYRVGGEQPVTMDVRVVCATNRDIFEMAQHGGFRRDLLYRINVIAIHMPPLRQRTGDLPLLADFFLKKYSAEFGKKTSSFSAEAMGEMVSHRWPGNVRQLQHAIERAVIHCRGETITKMNLDSDAEREQRPAPPDIGEMAAMDYAAMKERVLDFYEKEYLAALLARVRGSIQEACEQSGIDRKTMYRKMKQYGLDKKDYK